VLRIAPTENAQPTPSEEGASWARQWPKAQRLPAADQIDPGYPTTGDDNLDGVLVLAHRRNTGLHIGEALALAGRERERQLLVAVRVLAQMSKAVCDESAEGF
jgi:hypothetical protein